MPRLARIPRAEDVPVCPVCDGPCTHEFERGEYVFPDRLRKTPPEHGSRDPEPEKPKVKRRRGKRAKHGPDEDRMRRGPEHDR